MGSKPTLSAKNACKLLINKSFLAYHALTSEATIKSHGDIRRGFFCLSAKHRAAILRLHCLRKMNVSTSRIPKHADQQAIHDAHLGPISPRYTGTLTVGALTSKMGTFDLEMDSLVLKGSKLDFEMSGTDGTGKFMVEGSASLDPGTGDFVCPSASVCYTPKVAPSIPTRFVFALRQVTADKRPFCFISLRWEEDESNHWIAFALLEVAANQHAR